MEKPYSSRQRATQTSFSIVLPTPNTQTNLTHFPESKMANGPFWLKERGMGLRHHETWRQIQRPDIRHLSVHADSPLFASVLNPRFLSHWHQELLSIFGFV